MSLRESNNKELKHLNLQIEQEFSNIASLTVDEKYKLNESYISMISYFNKLTDEVEKRRVDLFKNILQMLTISMTSIGLLFSQRQNIPDSLYFPSIITFIDIIIFSLIIGVLFHAQSKYKYPFLNLDKYSNSWKWFYYGNTNISNIETNPFFPKKHEYASKELYLKGLLLDIRKINNESIDDEIRNSIVQSYLLKVHNYYKNQFYLKLAKFQYYLFVSIPAIFSLSFIISILYVYSFFNYFQLFSIIFKYFYNIYII